MIRGDAPTHGRTDAASRIAAAVRRCVGASVLVVLSSGCAYFNGMYNAKKYTRDAERSERAGRPGEARERWQRAAIHAESVVARRPNSRWADDARLVQGKALLRLGSFSEAIVALRQAVEAAQDLEQRREAWLLLGEAAAAARTLEEAGTALDSALLTARPERYSRALLARGRLRLLRRDAAGALADFEQSAEPEAPFWSARAALALGDADRAAAELQRLAAARRLLPHHEETWSELLDSLGRAGDPGRALAAGLVEQLAVRGGLTSGARARLVLADGSRAAAAGDIAAAGARFRAAAGIAPDSTEAVTAELRLELLALRGAMDDSALVRIRPVLQRIGRQGGEAAREADAATRVIARLEALAADTAPGADARWFARAELARDSLGMRTWAAAAFGAMAERFPASPWTPKALIAAIADGAADSAALAATLAARYADSPYVIAARGGDAERYAVLEDSLRLLLQRETGRTETLEGREVDDEPGARRPRPATRPAQPAPRPPGQPQPQPRDPQPRDPQP